MLGENDAPPLGDLLTSAVQFAVPHARHQLFAGLGIVVGEDHYDTQAQGRRRAAVEGPFGRFLLRLLGLGGSLRLDQGGLGGHGFRLKGSDLSFDLGELGGQSSDGGHAYPLDR